MYMCMIYQFLICFLCDVFILLTRVPVKCETKRETKYTETKRNLPKNETKSMRNEINRNEIDRKETKRYNTKWNKTYFNETISWGKTRPQLNEKNRENII